jgi:hypothetical protein
MLEFATKDEGVYLESVLNAAIMSDVFWMISCAIRIDGSVDYQELKTASELVSPSLHRYCWLSDYQRFSNRSGAISFHQLLSQWEKDGSWFGGDHDAGAILRPFQCFAIIATLVSKSPSVFQNYRKCMLLIARIVLSADGMTPVERQFYEKFSAVIDNLEKSISGLAIPPDVTHNEANTPSSGDFSPGEIRSPETLLDEGIRELGALVGVHSVKNEVNRLMNFFKIRQQRIAQGMTVPRQSLHFVFTGNPGTGKTTVARIVAKIMYGFQILNTANLLEADRSSMVGGYVGQTAIKTREVISKAANGVLFIDEAYMLAKSTGEDYGQEAIDTLLKQMEDLRDSLIVIVAGYPKEMDNFIRSNPGLESRFTRYIHFDDYHVADLCQIFDRMCKSHDYRLTPEARGNLAIMLNRAYTTRDSNFGNARFVRNAYELTVGNQAYRLAAWEGEITKDLLREIIPADLSYGIVPGCSGPLDVSRSRWDVKCPACGKRSASSVSALGRVVKCKCGEKFRCPWWNLLPETVPGLTGYEEFARDADLLGYERQ